MSPFRWKAVRVRLQLWMESGRVRGDMTGTQKHPLHVVSHGCYWASHSPIASGFPSHCPLSSDVSLSAGLSRPMVSMGTLDSDQEESP